MAPDDVTYRCIVTNIDDDFVWCFNYFVINDLGQVYTINSGARRWSQGFCTYFLFIQQGKYRSSSFEMLLFSIIGKFGCLGERLAYGIVLIPTA